MTRALQLDGREIDLAQFTYVLGLEGSADAFLELYSELVDEEFALPRWAFLRRARKRELQRGAIRLFEIFTEHARRQDQAR